MWKKIAIAGAVGAAVLGSGAAALAATASTSSSTASPNVTTSSTPSTGTATGTANGGKAGKGGKAGARLALRLRKLEHGEWVTTTKTGDVTHDAVEGMVTAVSPTSITVKAADGFSATYVVDSVTKVRVKGASGSISGIAVNDRVLASGTKSGATVTAVHILDAGPKK